MNEKESKAKKKQAAMPVEHLFVLSEPTRMYTAKELAAMPLQQMQHCRDAQEEYFIKSVLTLKPEATKLKGQLEIGARLISLTRKKRVRLHTEYFCDGVQISKRIINQLLHRKMIKVVQVAS